MLARKLHQIVTRGKLTHANIDFEKMERGVSGEWREDKAHLE